MHMADAARKGSRLLTVWPGCTYGNKRSDQNNLLSPLQEGAVHIWNRFGPLFASGIRRGGRVGLPWRQPRQVETSSH